jgi:hypothetical protein
MKLYKFLKTDGSPCNGGIGKWHLPKNGKPGEWMPPIEGPLKPCHNGYHLCRREDVLRWLGPALYEAEHKGVIIECDNKVVVRAARLIRKLNWDDKVARRFACDCAQRALELYGSPVDERTQQAIDIAIAYIEGVADEEGLNTAKSTASFAARSAARDAAWAAAGDAARDAAWAAAGAAAGDAARDAAWDVERQAQVGHFWKLVEQKAREVGE